MLVQLWKLFPEELKATKSNIICTNVTKNLFVKCIIIITIKIIE